MGTSSFFQFEREICQLALLKLASISLKSGYLINFPRVNLRTPDHLGCAYCRQSAPPPGTPSSLLNIVPVSRPLWVADTVSHSELSRREPFTMGTVSFIHAARIPSPYLYFPRCHNRDPFLIEPARPYTTTTAAAAAGREAATVRGRRAPPSLVTDLVFC